METAIDIRDLTVFYDDVLALEQINLTVQKGDFLTIIGPNGGGKSTLIKSILGLVSPTVGLIKIFGIPTRKSHGSVGYVPQFSKFDRKFPISVIEVVLMGRLTARSGFFHKYVKEDWEKAEEILARLHLSDLKDRQIGQLSGGQLQRVLIARAMVGNPAIYLLDEPTASVDSESKTFIYELLRQLNEEGKTIVLVTHDTNVVAHYSRSIACLNQKLHYHGDPELTTEILEEMYGCPVEMIAHGVPHRVLATHGREFG
ncbi:metal ABC transporter ATP-binding protein [Fervidibacillus albus]|uniref:Metal ABC transporter ATP-binding protein n=1 Tax=Fervidibacillus albus TaxID=2980026 RepID=A0A9E8RWI7_9BACI|nr:metal ABC transporter ATP-binding protein [Fervidibacillus albus]WAA10113.1 metal ABC transporter ATP-binding protein [Fervidibacillus albus]